MSAVKNFAIKFKKSRDKLGNYSIEGRELYQDKMVTLFDDQEILKIQNYYSLFMGFTVIPKEELSVKIGRCRLRDSTKIHKRCNRLFIQMFPENELHQGLVGHIMPPFHERLCVIKKNPAVREYASK